MTRRRLSAKETVAASAPDQPMITKAVYDELSKRLIACEEALWKARLAKGQLEEITDANIAALRSVSASAKLHMHRTVRLRRHKSQWITNAKRSLAAMAKRNLGL